MVKQDALEECPQGAPMQYVGQRRQAKAGRLHRAVATGIDMTRARDDQIEANCGVGDDLCRGVCIGNDGIEYLPRQACDIRHAAALGKGGVTIGAGKILAGANRVGLAEAGKAPCP